VLKLRGKLFAAFFFGLLLLAPAAAAANKPGEISCNGSSELCDRKLNQVVLPGTHNSMAAKELGWFNPNHTYSIPNQLKRGARAMLIDTYYGRPDPPQPNGTIQIRNAGAGPGDPLYLCHESCLFGASPLVPELEKVASFLKANPNEVLVFVNQDGVDPGDFAEAVEASGLLEYIYEGPTGPWPTLGEMIATNQRVVMTAEQDAAGVPWYHRAYGGAMRETPFNFPLNTDLITAPEQLEESCRPNRGEAAATDDSLFLMNHWTATDFRITGSFEPLIEWAEVVNQKDAVVNRARACEQRRGFLPNILAVDFFGTGDVVGAANELNEVAATATLRSNRLKPIVVRGGQRRLVAVTVTNSGDAPARSVRICASAPSRLVSRPACVRRGQMLAGQRVVVKLRVKVKRNARGSGALKVKVTSSARTVNLKTELRVKPVRKVRGR